MCFQLVVTHIVGFNQWKESSSNFENANDFVKINAKAQRVTRKRSLHLRGFALNCYYSFALNGCGQLYIESDRWFIASADLFPVSVLAGG